MEMNKKFRGVNFKPEEKKALIELISQYRDTIENKKTDGLSSRKKELAWEELTHAFNSNIAVVKRTSKQLKGFYENIKRRAKKKNTQDKLNLFKTGGGPNTQSTLDDAEVKILDIIKDRVEPMQNEFDSDATLYTVVDSGSNRTTEEVPSLENVDIIFEEGIEDSQAENISVEMDETLTTIPPDTPKKDFQKNKWKKRNRPTMQRCRRSEATQARENLKELSEARKMAINLEVEQMKEKHSAQMQLIKLQTEQLKIALENEQLRKEALQLEIQYYKNKIN